ncbi:MAG TPA: MFS transporter [Pirellulales bacterium]|jgi:MFS family permease
MTKGRIWFALGVLFAINLMNFYDRLIIGAVGEQIAVEWRLGDSELGYLGTAFILLYAAVGVPLGRLADRHNRSRILTVGVTIWSVLTAFSGFAQQFWQMVVLRLSVGVGEATCAPAANSLIGDLFPATMRARAMSIFMLGLPLGNAAALLVSGIVAMKYGWQSAFFVALVPGLLCAIGAAMLHEPKRGGTETHDIGARKRDGSPYSLVLSIPTMRWIIISGALHNFNMYAIGGFVSPLVIRVHGLNVQQAGYVSMAVYGLAGVPGMILGGLLGDAILRRRKNGRMLLAAWAIAFAVPLMYFALGQPAGQWLAFSVLFGLGCMMMYVYYATVYSTIQDVIEPSLRATAMALYFAAMYAFGGALGPTVIGKTSDYFANQAAAVDNVDLTTMSAAERLPYRALGLNTALYALPITSLLLAGSLFAGARTVNRDVDNLQRWMRETAGSAPPKPRLEKAVT